MKKRIALGLTMLAVSTLLGGNVVNAAPAKEVAVVEQFGDAIEEVTVDGFKYKISVAGEAMLVGGSFGEQIVVPETISYNNSDYKVVGIASTAFQDAKSTTSITLPSSVDTIHTGTFAGVNFLENVEVQSLLASVKDILPSHVNLTAYKDSKAYKEYQAGGFTGKLNAIQMQVNLHTNGADNASALTTQTVTAGDNVELTTPTRKNYVFDGWYTTADFTGTKYDKVLTAVYQKEIHLYAKWLPDATEHKINYVLSGGINGANPATYSTKNVTLKNPTKKGYVFAGWYLDTACTRKITTINYTTDADITVYAKWSKVGKATVKTAKQSGKKIKVVLKKVTNAEGYSVSYSKSKKFPKKSTTTVTTKKLTVKTKALKKGTYYVKASAYKVDASGKKVAGKASAVVKVKVK